jgi:hypothetical protein
MIIINIQPVVQPDYTQVNYLAIQAVNLGAQENDQSYGQAQYQIFDQNGGLVLGSTCTFSREESEYWITDEEFAKWLTIN